MSFDFLLAIFLIKENPINVYRIGVAAVGRQQKEQPGKRCPDDVDLAGFDGNTKQPRSSSSLLTILLPLYLIIGHGAQLLSSIANRSKRYLCAFASSPSLHVLRTASNYPSPKVSPRICETSLHLRIQTAPLFIGQHVRH